MNRKCLALIIPCFNEEDIIHISIDKLLNILSDLIVQKKISEDSYISFVDDGSSDNTWGIIKEIQKCNKKIKGIKLSRNFGHQYALYAGLVENDADIYISLDADLQDDLTLIEKMVDKSYEGFDIVYGVRNNRKTDTFCKRTTAALFYKVMNLLKIQTIPQHADYRLVTQKVINELKNIKETNLYLRGIIPTLGFKSTSLFYERKLRIGGTAKYNYLKSFMLALDGITSFSIMPLRLITILGCIISLISIIMACYALYRHYLHQIVWGWTSLFISIYFLGGLVLFTLGIIGEYIGRIYQETKQRQRYIVEEKIK